MRGEGRGCSLICIGDTVVLCRAGVSFGVIGSSSLYRGTSFIWKVMG